MRLSAGIIGLLHALSSLTAPSHSFQPSVVRRLSSSSSRSPLARGARLETPPPPPPSSFISSSSSSSSLGATTNPVEVLSAIASPVGSVSVLAFVILVHEAGHFLAARAMGMQVDEFSVGIGPRLLGVRRRSVDGGGFVFERIVDGDDDDEGTEGSAKDGIEFSLRAIPLGGYVRFPENYNRTLAFEREDAARKARNEARSMRIEGSTPVQKALEYMAASSFVLNVASLGSLKRWQSRRVEEQLRRAEEEMESRSNKLARDRGDASSWWNALPWVANKKGDGGGGSSGDEDDELTILRAAATEPTIDYFDDPNLLQNRP